MNRVAIRKNYAQRKLLSLINSLELRLATVRRQLDQVNQAEYENDINNTLKNAVFDAIQDKTSQSWAAMLINEMTGESL